MFASLRTYFSPMVKPDEELCLLQIFKPLYILLSALGLFPLAIEFPNTQATQRQSIVVSKNTRINAASTLAAFVVIHSFFAIHLLELNTNSKDNSMTEDNLTALNYTIGLITQVFFCTVSYFYAIHDRKLYIKMLKDLDDCWNRLRNGKRRLILGQLRVQVNCVVLGSVLIMFLLLAVITYTGNTNVWKVILISLTFNLPELIQFTMIAFYLVMVLMIVALLKSIDEELLVIMSEVGDNVVKTDLRVDIAEVREVYVKTMRIKRQVTAVFQAPILSALAMIFHELVSAAHLVYHGLSFQSNFSAHDVVECSCWLLNQFAKLHALAQSGCLLISQVNRIGRTIHRIPKREEQNIEVYLKIQHFSSLMSFQETAITVFGYFPLDPTLMFNIVSSAAIYLVIMVQFDK